MTRRNAMRPKALVAGRSFFFNLIFVVLNLAGITTLLFGFHASFADNSLWLKVLGFSLFAFSIAGLILFRGRLMINNFARVFVGGIFIVSGLVKANDPIGFSYKLEEYFEDGALAYRIKEWFGMPDFSFEYLIPMALGIAVFICIVEIVLGVLLLFRQKMKIVTVLVMSMMLFFTFLTWHTASCDNKANFSDRDHYSLNSALGQLKVQQTKTDKKIKLIAYTNEIIIEEIKTPQCVNDCGCFGDAMKGSLGRSLTPSESFWKDLILLYLSIWLVAGAFKKNTIPEENRTWYWLPALSLIRLLSWVFGWFFPVLFSFVAFFGTLWLLRNDKIKANKHWPVIGWVTFLSVLLISYVLLYEPIKDYRPYAVGSNLKKKMNDGVDGKYENILVYKNNRTGKIRKMNEATYNVSKIWKNKDWKFVRNISTEKVAIKLPSITKQFDPFVAIENLTKSEIALDFVSNKMLPVKGIQYEVYDMEKDTLLRIESSLFSRDEYEENRFLIKDTVEFIKNQEEQELYILEDILKQERIIILTAKNISEANWAEVGQYKSILQASKKDGIPMILLTNSSNEEINAFRKKYNFEIAVFTNEEIELKAIARSNPSIMVLKKGVVKGKYPHRATPDYKWLRENVLN